MIVTRRIQLIALLAVLAPISALGAQRVVWLNLGGGVSIPQGTLRDGADPGWHALGALSITTLTQPIGLRIEGAHNRFAFTDRAETAAGGAGEQVTSSATLNLTYRLPMANSPLSPYLITGAGAYHSACTRGPACDGETKFGWSAGLGTKMFVGLRSFLEARYHRSSRAGRSVAYFPLSVGITF